MLHLLVRFRAWLQYHHREYRSLVAEGERHRARQAEQIGVTTTSDREW
jgi:hypothetical protein